MARLADLLAFRMRPSDVDTVVFLVFSSAALYVVLMALPFMPGIEVGLMLMAMIGAGGVVPVFPKYLLLVCLVITPVPLLFLLRAAHP